MPLEVGGSRVVRDKATGKLRKERSDANTNKRSEQNTNDASREERLRDLQRDLAASGTKLTTKQRKAILEGEDVSVVRANIEQDNPTLTEARMDRVTRKKAQEYAEEGKIVVSEDFNELYESRRDSGEIRQALSERRYKAIRANARQAASYDNLVGGYSTPTSNASGEGVGGVMLGSEGVTSFEDPYVLEMRGLQAAQIERTKKGIPPTSLQFAAGRAAGSLRGFANRQYREADTNTFSGRARVAAGDVAVALQDPIQRYGFGDKRLGKEVTVSYVSGLGFGSLLGAGGSLIGRTVTTRSGSLMFGRAATGAVNVLGVGGATVLAGSQLVGASPAEVGRQLPGLGAGLAGGVQGFRAFSSPPIQVTTTPKFLGVSDATPPPRTNIRFNNRGLAASSASSREAVVSVFGGKPLLGRQFTQTSFTGDAFVTTSAGSGYSGDVLTSQKTSFPLGERSASVARDVRGKGFLDFRTGRSGYVTPAEKQFSQVTLSASRGDGFEGQIGSTVRLRNNKAYLENFGQVLSPTKEVSVPSRITVIEQTPKSFMEASRTGTAQESFFNVKTARAQSTEITKGSAENALKAFGLGTEGVPRTQVLNPRVTRLYSDPTLGVASTLSQPRAPSARLSLGEGTKGGLRTPKTGLGLSSSFVLKEGFTPGLGRLSGVRTNLLINDLEPAVSMMPGEILVSGVRTSVLPAVASVQRTGFGSAQEVLPAVDTLPLVGVTTRSTTDTVQRPVTDIFRGSTSVPPPPPVTESPPPPFMPPLPVFPPNAALGRGTTKKGKGRTQPFGYTSSLAGLFGFGGTKSKAQAKTGIAIRRFF